MIRADNDIAVVNFDTFGRGDTTTRFATFSEIFRFESNHI